MSAIQKHHDKSHEGFTLVELLIVLGLVAFLAGVAVPQMNTFLRSIQFSFDRADIQQRLSDLPFRAFIGNKKIILGEPADEDQEPETSPETEASEILSLPEGWSYSTENPITYRSDGLCMGGEIQFDSEAGRKLNFILDAPHCFPRLPGDKS